MKTIHTNLFSKPAFDILSATFGQLSDGWGPTIDGWGGSSPSLEKWWKFADVSRLADGEIVIEISEDSMRPAQYGRGYTIPAVYNGWIKFSTQEEILKQVANWIKRTIYMEIADEGNSLKSRRDIWKRDNVDFKSRYLYRSDAITIQDIYMVVDSLTGKIKPANYSAKAIERLIGTPVSISTQKTNSAKREARKTSEAQFRARIADMQETLEADKKALDAKYSAQRAELTEAYRAFQAGIGPDVLD